MSRATKTIRDRLEYLRGELRAERISYGELAELQELAKYIEPGDVELLEAAGVPEASTGTTDCDSCGWGRGDGITIGSDYVEDQNVCDSCAPLVLDAAENDGKLDRVTVDGVEMSIAEARQRIGGTQ